MIVTQLCLLNSMVFSEAAKTTVGNGRFLLVSLSSVPCATLTCIGAEFAELPAAEVDLLVVGGEDSCALAFALPALFNVLTFLLTVSMVDLLVSFDSYIVED